MAATTAPPGTLEPGLDAHRSCLRWYCGCPNHARPRRRDPWRPRLYVRKPRLDGFRCTPGASAWPGKTPLRLAVTGCQRARTSAPPRQVPPQRCEQSALQTELIADRVAEPPPARARRRRVHRRRGIKFEAAAGGRRQPATSLHVTNLFEGDVFSWYMEALPGSPDLVAAVREIIAILDGQNLARISHRRCQLKATANRTLPEMPLSSLSLSGRTWD